MTTKTETVAASIQQRAEADEHAVRVELAINLHRAHLTSATTRSATAGRITQAMNQLNLSPAQITSQLKIVSDFYRLQKDANPERLEKMRTEEAERLKKWETRRDEVVEIKKQLDQECADLHDSWWSFSGGVAKAEDQGVKLLHLPELHPILFSDAVIEAARVAANKAKPKKENTHAPK